MLSESERFEAECSGKRGYRNKANAKRVLATSMSLGGEKLWMYRCTWCGEWHLGHANAAKWRSGAHV